MLLVVTAVTSPLAHLQPQALVSTVVDIPAAGIALIMGVDRILDMCRTAINVSGDLTAAKLIDHWRERH